MKKKLHDGHRQRMRETYLKYGLDAFSDVEKIEFMLYFAISRKDTNPIAHSLIEKYGTIDRVLEAPINDLKRINGMGEWSAMLLSSVIPMSIASKRVQNNIKIKGTATAKAFARKLFTSASVEEFYIICLAANNSLIETKLLGKGSRNEVPVNISNITKTAHSLGCERIIIMHNHPDGAAKPSDEDVSFTIKILLTCILNDIEVLDHIVVNPTEEFSFQEAGILAPLKANASSRVPGMEESRSKFSTDSSNYVVGK